MYACFLIKILHVGKSRVANTRLALQSLGRTEIVLKTLLYATHNFRPANLENVFRGTFRVKKRDLPAKRGTVGRAHIEIFLEV